MLHLIGFSLLSLLANCVTLEINTQPELLKRDFTNTNLSELTSIKIRNALRHLRYDESRSRRCQYYQVAWLAARTGRHLHLAGKYYTRGNGCVGSDQRTEAEQLNTNK